MSDHNKHQHDHKNIYLAVASALLLLTAITVWTSYHDFGTWNMFVAMLIATIKASLVALFFMHLLEDQKFNQVVFASSFVFFALFIGLTASDIFYRTPQRPAVIAKVSAGNAMSEAELSAWSTPSPEMQAKGKALYDTRCASCHGADGKGNGVAGGALTPPPRNFTATDGWKFGRSPAQVFGSVTQGSPGTAMSAFADTLSPEERWQVVQYLRTLMPSAPEDTPETIADMKKRLGLDGAAATAHAALPLDVALRLMATDAPAADTGGEASNRKSAPNEDHPGAPLYQNFCASCHGAAGEGGVKVTTLGVRPAAYVVTAPLKGTSDNHLQSAAEFTTFIARGRPGAGKPGISHFTNEEWGALYEYVQLLANGN